MYRSSDGILSETSPLHLSHETLRHQHRHRLHRSYGSLLPYLSGVFGISSSRATSTQVFYLIQNDISNLEK